MRRRIALVTLVVDDYDEAIRFYTEALGSGSPRTSRGRGGRWVVVEPGGDGQSGGLLLAKAAVRPSAPGSATRPADAWVSSCTPTTSPATRPDAAAGVTFLEEPRHESYGSVAVFEDLYGNRGTSSSPPPTDRAARAVPARRRPSTSVTRSDPPRTTCEERTP
ncbi:VOC family protein [Streptomyces scabiei]|uniref:VOC family protein n=1 Tax=Streptomyces scabiei TaxID=1930 RepID=UPI002FF2E7A6